MYFSCYAVVRVFWFDMQLLCSRLLLLLLLAQIKKSPSTNVFMILWSGSGLFQSSWIKARHCLQLDIQILEKWNTMLCCWTHPLTAVRAEDGSCSVHHLCRVCNSVTVSAGALGNFKMFSSVKTVCVCVFHRLQYIHFMFKWNQSPAEPNNEQHSVTIRICSCYNSYLLMHASYKHNKN